MKKFAPLILLLIALIPIAYAQELEAISAPGEVTKGDVLTVYIKFVNTYNETVIVTKVRMEIVNQNGDLVNSSETNMYIPVPANASATVSGSIKVDIQPGDYKYNVIVYYKKGDSTESRQVISEKELIVKNPSNPRLVLAITTLIFGITLGFLVRIGSRGLTR